MLQFENQEIKHIVHKALPVIASVAILYSCASVGRPGDGPRDYDPPRFVGSTSAAGAINNKRAKVSLQFDKLIKLKKATEKVAAFPPRIQQPETGVSGKKIQVDLLDSLKSNTTHTIDFSDTIVDNNEGNPLGSFAFIFSTGAQIGIMEVSETVFGASNLEPIKGILVGLHADLSNPTFTRPLFNCVARIGNRRRFSTRRVAPDKYRIFGLMDSDQNFAFTQKGGVIALNDSPITPCMEERLRMDTTWADSLTYDAIVEKKYMHCLPDDVILCAFREPNYSQHLIKPKRLAPQKFTFYLAGKADTLPVLKGLNLDGEETFVIEKNQRNGAIHYRVKGSLLHKQDTLALSLTYLYTDMLNQLIPRTDISKLVSKQKTLTKEESEKKKKKKKKEGKEDEPMLTKFLPANANTPSSMDVCDYVSLNFEEPIASLDIVATHLRQRVDTIWKDIPFEFEQDSLSLRWFNLYPKSDRKSTVEYEFLMNSTAFHDIYGLSTDEIKQSFKVRSEDKYFIPRSIVTGIDPQAFVELLNTRDEAVRRRLVEDRRADFYYLNPGEYTIRLISDRNGDEEWDTGDYTRGVQPEEAYYFPKVVEYRALWGVGQNWDIHATPVDRQKLDELKKQKPDKDKKKKERERDRNNQNHNRR